MTQYLVAIYRPEKYDAAVSEDEAMDRGELERHFESDRLGGGLLVDERFREAPRSAHQPLEALTNRGRHGVPTAAQAPSSLRIAIENHRSARRHARFV